MKKKVLIIRFSSIGDIIQCMSVTQGIKAKFTNCELHWVTRKDMASLLKIDPDIDKIWEYEKKEGFRGLLHLIRELRKQKYTYVYDAHSNIRSNLIYFLFKLSFCQSKWVTRHKNRVKRILLFKFRINLLPKPFRSIESFQNPLKKWNISFANLPDKSWVFPQPVNQKATALMEKEVHKEKTITLVPSAAWDLKRWPIEHWKQLITILPQYRFIIIGGPNDIFCEELKQTAPDKVINLAGKTSLMESFCITFLSDYVISGDTGFLHAADLFNKQGIALIGPTAFGFTSGKKMHIMEVPLKCRPCTKDGNVKCKNTEFKKCMMDIYPATLKKHIELHYL